MLQPEGIVSWRELTRTSSCCCRSANRPASASPGGSRQQGSLRQAFGGTESGHRRSGSGGASASAALSPVEGPLRLRKANQAAAPAW